MKTRFAKLPFTKMHGLGNDFVLMEAVHLPPELASERSQSALAALACHRNFGVGSDGLIIVAPPTDPQRFDTRFVFYNSDGTPAEMCGNGIRCFARYLQDRQLVPHASEALRVETLAGLMVPTVHPDGSVTVDMGPPILEAGRIPFTGTAPGETVQNFPLTVLGQTLPVTLVSMGNPHCLIFDAPELDPAVFGPAIETHPLFPAKTNVEFVEVVDARTLRVVVWERGCGFTLACGTGACATAVGAALLGKTEPEATVHLPGGPLEIRWSREGDGHVWMTGPATEVFTGELTVDLDALTAN